MTRDELDALRRLAEQEPSMTRVALDDIANPDAIRRQLQAEFDQSIRNKESNAQLMGRLQRVVDMTRSRAATITQTEKTRAANGERMAQAIREYTEAYNKAVRGHRKRPDLPVFQWVNPLRAREPRHKHVAISGTKRPIGQEFLPDLHYPGDPQAPASETINCHCYIRRVGS